MQAQKISRKAASTGFEWDALDDVWAQVREEESELREAYAVAPKTPDGKIVFDAVPDERSRAVEVEFGDLLFALVNVGRRMGINSEGALRASCAKFRARWAHIERCARACGVRVEELSQPELERLWQQAKEAE